MEKKLFVDLMAHTGGLEMIAAMGARLCYSDADITTLYEMANQQDQGPFLQKLVEMGHMSPIEHVNFSFGIEGVSRALLAQITRHRLASFSVQSQRYVAQSNENGFDYIVPPRIKQLGEWAEEKYKAQMEQIDKYYKDWISALGVANKEDARFILPNASETRMVMTINARELIHIIRLRGCNRAQWEIRAMAWAMLAHCIRVAPALFNSCGPSCLFGSCGEGKMSCKKGGEMREMYGRLLAFIHENKYDENFAVLASDWATQNINE